MNLITVGLVVLVVGAMAIGFSYTAPANTVQFSVAQGNVYDVYRMPFAGGPWSEIDKCTSFGSTSLYNADGNDFAVYQLALDPSCGPIVMVTETTLGGLNGSVTTFTSGAQFCPPGYTQEPPGRTCAPTGSPSLTTDASSFAVPQPPASNLRYLGAVVVLAGIALVVVGKRRGDPLPIKTTFRVPSPE